MVIHVRTSESHIHEGVREEKGEDDRPHFLWKDMLHSSHTLARDVKVVHLLTCCAGCAGCVDCVDCVDYTAVSGVVVIVVVV